MLEKNEKNIYLELTTLHDISDAIVDGCCECCDNDIKPDVWHLHSKNYWCINMNLFKYRRVNGIKDWKPEDEEKVLGIDKNGDKWPAIFFGKVHNKFVCKEQDSNEKENYIFTVFDNIEPIEKELTKKNREPRELWKNEYLTSGFTEKDFITKEDAKANRGYNCIGQILFREVL